MACNLLSITPYSDKFFEVAFQTLFNVLSTVDTSEI